MKSVSVYLLLCALAVMTYLNVGQVAQVSIDIASAKSEAQREMHRSGPLSEITLTDHDFASGKAKYTDKDEISIDGKLYDIASKNQTGDKLDLKVRNDEKEEGLLSDLKNMVDNWFGAAQKDGPKQPLAKQIDLIKDFIPTTAFQFHFSHSFEMLAPAAYIFPSQSPLVAVLKSPPQLG